MKLHEITGYLNSERMENPKLSKIIPGARIYFDPQHNAWLLEFQHVSGSTLTEPIAHPGIFGLMLTSDQWSVYVPPLAGSAPAIQLCHNVVCPNCLKQIVVTSDGQVIKIPDPVGASSSKIIT